MKPETESAVNSMGTRSELPARIAAYSIFFLSGAAALIYEISWSRQIGLLFGHTVHAASVVLGSYFAGMAIGYLVGARWSSRVSPLFGYAMAEMCVAVWAIFIPVLLGFSETSTVAPWLSSPSFVWQTTARVVFSFLLLLPATIALGATLPMMAEFLACDGGLSDSENSRRVTMAYALNTTGALTGVLVATFYLLIVVGVCRSSYVAAALSAICALVAVCVAWPREKVGGSRGDNRIPVTNENKKLRVRYLVLAALSGFGTLALQVLYTRMFSLVFHNSTYTFGIVIAVFLASLALGTALTARLMRRYDARQIIGFSAGFGALTTALSVLVFVGSTELKYFNFGNSFVQYMSGALLLVSAVVGPPITFLAMILPLVWRLAGDTDAPGRVVGKLTAANTIASAGGAMAASFCLLPWIGLWPSMVFVAALFFVAACWLLWRIDYRRSVWALGLMFGGLSFFVWRSPIEAEYSRIELGEHLVKRWNSPYGWIDVVQRKKTGAFKIRQNLHYRFGTTGTNVREYRQAHIPLLLHKNPKDVLFLGLGTGLTAGGAIPHADVKNIVAVELIPEVVEAARTLARYNYNIVDHAKSSIRVDDARHFMLAHDRKFDVIVSDLFVPWESESGYLYTVEHYQIALQRLKPDGLFCQWIPLFQVGPREFESIANSFSSVFPHTTVWWGKLAKTSPVIALIGTTSPLRIDAEPLKDRLQDLNLRLDTTDPSIATVQRFCDHYIGDWKFQPGAQLNTDEHPRVEFLTPVSNRDKQMIRGEALERYYNDVLARLPIESALLRGDRLENSSKRHRARQRLILFGN